MIFSCALRSQVRAFPRIAPPITVVLTLVLLAAGCGGDAAHTAFERSDSAGVVIARTLLPAAETVRVAEPLARVGMVDGPPEYLFELISDVQPLPA